MKPSQLETPKASRLKFDFDVLDFTPRYKKGPPTYKRGPGPKLLPIFPLLPNDKPNIIIKHKYEEKEITFYVVGDPSQPADRRVVKAPRILDFVSRRIYENYEAALLETVQNRRISTESTPSVPSVERKSDVKKFAVSRRSTSEVRDVEMGDVSPMFVSQDTAFAPVFSQKAPQSPTWASSSSSQGMFVDDKNEDAVGFADAKAAHTTSLSQLPQLPQTASPKPRRRYKGPFLPDSSDEEAPVPPKSTKPSVESNNKSIANEIDLLFEGLMGDDDEVEEKTSTNRKRSFSAMNSGSDEFESSSRMSSTPGSRGTSSESIEEKSATNDGQPKKKKRRPVGWETRKRRNRDSSRLKRQASDEDDEWELDGILDDEMRKGSDGEVIRWFKVDWVGHWDPTWEPEANVSNDAVESYYRKKDRQPAKSNMPSKSVVKGLFGKNLSGFREQKEHHFKHHIHLKTIIISNDGSDDQPLADVTRYAPTNKVASRQPSMVAGIQESDKFRVPEIPVAEEDETAITKQLDGGRERRRHSSVATYNLKELSGTRYAPTTTSKVASGQRSMVAEISTSNALAKLKPPAPDAKPGDPDAPWLKLTAWELAKFRKMMKKNAEWNPSDTMIARELQSKGRGIEDYNRHNEGLMAAGLPPLQINAVSAKRVLEERDVSAATLKKGELSNRGVKLNEVEVKKLKREAEKRAAEDPIAQASTPTIMPDTQSSSSITPNQESDKFRVPAIPVAKADETVIIEQEDGGRERRRHSSVATYNLKLLSDMQSPFTKKGVPKVTRDRLSENEKVRVPREFSNGGMKLDEAKKFKEVNEKKATEDSTNIPEADEAWKKGELSRQSSRNSSVSNTSIASFHSESQTPKATEVQPQKQPQISDRSFQLAPGTHPSYKKRSEAEIRAEARQLYSQS